jgi:hypothetical protein
MESREPIQWRGFSLSLRFPPSLSCLAFVVVSPVAAEIIPHSCCCSCTAGIIRSPRGGDLWGLARTSEGPNPQQQQQQEPGGTHTSWEGSTLNGTHHHHVALDGVQSYSGQVLEDIRQDILSRGKISRLAVDA